MSVQIGNQTFPLGHQWPHDPKPEGYWKKLAAVRAKEYYEARERRLQEERQRNAAERGRKKLLSTTPREDMNFNFAAERDTFVTPNKLVALKALDHGAKFLDVVEDASRVVWYRFVDNDGKLRDGLCPSCGGDDIRTIPERGVAYRICYTTGCNFRWLEEPPNVCPRCEHGLEVRESGGDVIVKCENRFECAFERKLGHLPRVPISDREAEVLAFGAQDVEVEELKV